MNKLIGNTFLLNYLYRFIFHFVLGLGPFWQHFREAPFVVAGCCSFDSDFHFNFCTNIKVFEDIICSIFFICQINSRVLDHLGELLDSFRVFWRALESFEWKKFLNFRGSGTIRDTKTISANNILGHLAFVLYDRATIF